MKILTRIFNQILSYTLRGVIVVVPMVAVYLTAMYLYDLIKGYELFGSVWIMVGVVILGLIVVGFATKFLIFRPLFNLFERVLTQTPLVKFVYTSIKDLLKAFVGDQRRFSKPVLVNLIEETQLERFGFVTTEDMEKLGEGFAGKVTVYIPMSYSFSGNLFVVPGRLVQHLPNVDSAELMKFILSGGVTDLGEMLKEEIHSSSQKTS